MILCILETAVRRLLIKKKYILKNTLLQLELAAEPRGQNLSFALQQTFFFLLSLRHLQSQTHKLRRCLAAVFKHTDVDSVNSSSGALMTASSALSLSLLT